MVILALDVATITGCCDGTVGLNGRVWSWYLRDGGDTRPQRLFHLSKFLRKYFQTQPCDGVVYELPMPIGFLTNKTEKRVMMSEDNLSFLRGSIGVVEATACEFNKPIQGLSVQDARQSILGWRRNPKANKEGTKVRVFREVTTIFKVECDNDNESDAWVLWAFACARANPRVAIQMAPLFGGPMR